MSDNNDQNTFRDLLPVKVSAGQWKSVYHSELTNEETKRLFAVLCALELVRADDKLTLNQHLEQLSEYADVIQNALKVSE